MINGAHFLLYSKDAEADRAFFRDVLEWAAVDVGHNWLIFRLPPAEMAVHPGDGNFIQKHAEGHMLGIVLYLMCDDLNATMRLLEAKGVCCLQGDSGRLGKFHHGAPAQRGRNRTVSAHT